MSRTQGERLRFKHTTNSTVNCKIHDLDSHRTTVRSQNKHLPAVVVDPGMLAVVIGPW